MMFHLVCSPHERAALMLLLTIGRAAYFRSGLALEAREVLDRIPTEYLESLFAKVEAAASAEVSDA